MYSLHQEVFFLYDGIFLEGLTVGSIWNFSIFMFVIINNIIDSHNGSWTIMNYAVQGWRKINA